MTENKRFDIVKSKLIKDGWVISDKLKQFTFPTLKGDKRALFSYCKALNELAEENKDLEEARSYYQENFLTMKTERNQLKQENKELKSILQDMGLIMSNEEVKNVRDEIASKLIKPLCKGNGFDVDVNTENGFTIIPKEVNNGRE